MQLCTRHWQGKLGRNGYGNLNKKQHLFSSNVSYVPYTSSNKSTKRVKTTSLEILSFEKMSSSNARSNAVLPSRSYCCANFSLFSSITLWSVMYCTQ